MKLKNHFNLIREFTINNFKLKKNLLVVLT